EQALTSQVDGNERCGARGLDGDAWSGKVELVRDPCCQEIFVVAEMRQARGLPIQRGVSRMGKQVAGDDTTPTGVHTDDAFASLRVIPGVLERLPCDLEQQPLLRVEQRRLPRGETKEGSVEFIGVG